MNQSKDEIVIVRRTAPASLLPEAVLDDTSVTVGSKYLKGTKSVLMGLDRLERELILPAIIEVQPTDPNWEKEVKLFYANLNIIVPPEGKELNKGMTQATRIIGQKERLVDFPINPEQYVTYRQLLVDNSVANSREAAQSGRHIAYIEDLAAEREREITLRKDVAAIERAYLSLTDVDGNAEYKDQGKIRAVIYCFGLNPDAHTVEDMVGILDQRKRGAISDVKNGTDFRSTNFMTVVNDPSLPIKAQLYKLIIMGEIKNTGSYFVDPNNMEKVYGKDIDDLVSYWNSETNQTDVMQWRHILQESKKLV